ncbi:hypothetical protein H9L39_06823 [Fusarium oxysporum f. sp. albedinis]|nr:hypothetical protein H9L39_06823 [Fusarium oxysporum f. sp. albedinis]
MNTCLHLWDVHQSVSETLRSTRLTGTGTNRWSALTSLQACLWLSIELAARIHVYGWGSRFDCDLTAQVSECPSTISVVNRATLLAVLHVETSTAAIKKTSLMVYRPPAGAKRATEISSIGSIDLHKPGLATRDSKFMYTLII